MYTKISFRQKRILACTRKVRMLKRLLNIPDYPAWVIEELSYYEEELERLDVSL